MDDGGISQMYEETLASFANISINKLTDSYSFLDNYKELCDGEIVIFYFIYLEYNSRKCN